LLQLLETWWLIGLGLPERSDTSSRENGLSNKAREIKKKANRNKRKKTPVIYMFLFITFNQRLYMYTSRYFSLAPWSAQVHAGA
jgi:hypothetical protein